jgi:PTS system N-acetylglucosamine-specific IIA component
MTAAGPTSSGRSPSEVDTVLAVLAPVPGRAVPLAAVPDPVFAEAMVGPGTAIDPERAAGIAVAPVDGRIATLHPHAFVVVGAAGRGVLVHLGLDTVQLKGVGFEVLVAPGAEVSAGQPMVRWDPGAVHAGGRSPVCPVIALDATPDRLADLRETGDVRAGDLLFRWT